MASSLDHVQERIGGRDLLKWHRQNGLHIPIQAYVNLYQAQVAKGMQHTKAVYLDTNYWVLLRETATSGANTWFYSNSPWPLTAKARA